MKSYHRDGFTWLAYLILAFYGYFLNILGPITPFLKSELNLTYTVSSLHFTAFALGMLVVGLFGHLLIHRIGRWRSLWIGTGGMSLSAIILLAGRNPVITIAACFLMGLIGSLILVVVPSALSDQQSEYTAVAFSEANSIASLVATAAPLMVGWFAGSAGGWRGALAIAVLVPLLMGLFFRKAVPPPDASLEESLLSRRASLPVLFWIYWVALVLAVSIEFCMVFWSADYLENALGMAKVDAARSVSVFLAAMILGRLAGSRLVKVFSTSGVVAFSILLAGVGFLIYWQSGIILPGLAGLFITGLGVASLYPLIFSLAIGAAKNNAVQASARATLASGTAILALPLTLGRLADSVGIHVAYGVVAVLLVGIFLMIQFAKRVLDSKKKIIHR